MLSRKNNRWTEEEDGLMRQLAARGMSEQQVALKLHRSRSSIKNRAKELGVMFKEQSRLPWRDRWASTA